MKPFPPLAPMTVACLSLACAKAEPAADSGQPAAEDLATRLTTPGPHGVGYTVSELVYPDPAGAGDRGLRLAWWYPSTDDTAAATLRYRELLDGSGAALDAAPAAGSFPLAIFSHGHTGFAENSSFLMTHLASHGWVVVAPDHTGNTFFDGQDRETDVYLQRPLDLVAVLDHALSADGHPMAGQISADHTVVLGHSFGGYGILALAGARYDLDNILPACDAGTGPSSFCSTMSPAYAERFAAGFSETRIRAWIPMAPGDFNLFGAAGCSGLSAPVLLMTGELDPRTGDDAGPYWAALDRGENRHIELLGGGHQTFTDFSGVLESFEGLMDPAEGFRITIGYVLAFALRHGLGDVSAQPVLDGELSLSSEALLVP